MSSTNLILVNSLNCSQSIIKPFPLQFSTKSIIKYKLTVKKINISLSCASP